MRGMWRRQPSEAETCRRCTKARGSNIPHLSTYLTQNADREDELSIPGCSVYLADGEHSSPIDVVTYVTRVPIETSWQGPRVPVLAFKGERIEIFLDKSHPAFPHLSDARQSQ